jgi:hypothetical protein
MKSQHVRTERGVILATLVPKPADVVGDGEREGDRFPAEAD